MLRWGLINRGINPGQPLAAERPTPDGLLKWRIVVRDDGENACDGLLPTLIEWGPRHPTDAMPVSPLTLAELTLSGLPPAAIELLRLRGVATPPAGEAEPGLRVVLDTPRGRVQLESFR